MCNKKYLAGRVDKAKKAMQFAVVVSRNKDGKPRTILTPGKDMRDYHVIIRRHGVISVELNVDTGFGLLKPKFASRFITYHSMAALMICAKEAGRNISWCANKEDAENLSRLGGRVFAVVNHDNSSVVMYGVYNDN